MKSKDQVGEGRSIVKTKSKTAAGPDPHDQQELHSNSGMKPRMQFLVVKQLDKRWNHEIQLVKNFKIKVIRIAITLSTQINSIQHLFLVEELNLR